MSENDVTLPMSEMKQSAILGHLMVNPNFWMSANNKIEWSWFRNPYHQKVYKILKSCHATINRLPNTHELKNWAEFGKLDQADRNKCYNTIDQAKQDAARIALDTIKPELTVWLQAKLLRDSQEKANSFWNNGKYDKCAELLAGGVKGYQEAKFEESERITFEGVEKIIQAKKDQKERALPSGLKLLDEILCGPGAKGGLRRQEGTLLLAPVNIGKSSVLINIVVANIKVKNDVFMMFHEGDTTDLKSKIIQCYLRINENQFFEMYATEKGKQILEAATFMIDEYLFMFKYQKAGMVVEDAIQIFLRENDKLRLQKGKSFDLVVNDYPAKTSTKKSSGGMPLRQEREIVYDYWFNAAAQPEVDAHVICAYQVNREAVKENSGHNGRREEDRRLGSHEDSSESMGPANSAALCISANRSPEDQENNRLLFHLSKSRQSAAFVTIACKTDFSIPITHHDSLGCVAWRGNRVFPHSVERLIKEHNGKLLGKAELTGIRS